MRHTYTAHYQNVCIRPLEESDIEYLRNWRNDKVLSRYLSDVGYITQEAQRQWYKEYLNDSTIITFAIEEIKHLNRVVGSVALYDFKGSVAEVGKIVVGDSQAHGQKIGYYGMILAMRIGYENLNIEKYELFVHENNIAAKKNYERIGFVETGKHLFEKGGYEIEMEMSKESFLKKHDYLWLKKEENYENYAQ